MTLGIRGFADSNAVGDTNQRQLPPRRGERDYSFAAVRVTPPMLFTSVGPSRPDERFPRLFAAGDSDDGSDGRFRFRNIVPSDSDDGSDERSDQRRLGWLN